MSKHVMFSPLVQTEEALNKCIVPREFVVIDIVACTVL